MVWHGNAQHRRTRRHPTIRRGSRVGGDERPAGCGGDASALHAQLHSVRGERGGVVGVDDGGSKRRTTVAVAVARHNVRFNTATRSSRPQTRQHSHTRTHTQTAATQGTRAVAASTLPPTYATKTPAAWSTRNTRHVERPISRCDSRAMATLENAGSAVTRCAPTSTTRGVWRGDGAAAAPGVPAFAPAPTRRDGTAAGT